jgi:hypothetical protein
MKNCAGLACHHARERWPAGRRLTGVALIFQLLFFLGSNHGHRFIPHGVVGIFSNHDKNIGRTNGYAVPAAITFFRIDGDEEIARGIFISVIG